MVRAPRARLLASLVAVAIFFVAHVASADESPRWDTSDLWAAAEWRFGSSVHQTTLARTIDICRPYGRSCDHVTSVPRSTFDGDRVESATADFGADVLALGPLRLGLDMSLGGGDGPSTRAHAVPGVVDGWIWSQGMVDLGLRFRGDRWAAFTDLTGGFITMNASVAGIKDASDLSANAGGYVVGARAGGGVLVTQWLSASLYASAATGQVNDVSAGLRLELRMDTLLHVAHR
jgi:hypothetical protein